MLAAAWLAVRPDAAGASPPALPLDEAVHLAVQRAAGLDALQHAAEGLRASAVAAGQLPDPVLRLSLDNVPVQGPERFSTTREAMTMRSVAVMQTFTRDDKRRARVARTERQAEAVLAERAARQAEVQRATAVAWFERLAHEQRVAALQDQLALAQQQIEAADAGARGGRAALGDMVEARDAAARLRQALRAAQGELAAARLGLARWTGTTADRQLGPAPAVSQAPRGHVQGEAFATRHPELVRLAGEEAVAEAAAAQARAEREPDWSVELMFSQRGERYANMASVAVSLPLPWDRPQRQDRELAARLAQVQALRAEREERERALRAEVAQWAEGWAAGIGRLGVIDDERMPLARQREQTALAAYRGGGAPLAAVLDARDRALALVLERIDVALETARLWAQLEYLLPDHAALAAKEP